MQTQSPHTAPPSPQDLSLERQIRFGIGKRLLSAFGVVGALCILTSAVAWYSLTNLSDTQEAISTRKVPAMTTALQLANQTTRLVASAPLLAGAKDDETRQAQFDNITRTLSKAKTEINGLNAIITDAARIDALQNRLEQLPPIMQRIDDIVRQLHLLEQRRGELSTLLLKIRQNAEEKIKPLSSDITFRVIGHTDDWYSLLLDSIDRTKAGEEVDPDTAELEEKALDIVSFQAAIMEYRALTNLLIGMLIEGSQKQNGDAIKQMQDRFYKDIARMAAPLSQLSKAGDVQALDDIYNQLLKLGNTGEEQDNILKLRLKELSLKQEAAQLMGQARAQSNALSGEVENIVATLKNDMNTAVTQNAKTAQGTSLTLSLVAILSLVVVILIGWFYVMRNLVRRLMLLVDNMKAIAGGDLSTRVNRNGQDEISLMGAALAVLRNGLRETEALKQTQEEERLRNEQEKHQQAEKLADEFDEAVGHAIAVLSENVGDIRNKASNMNDIARQTLDETEEVSKATTTMSSDITIVAGSTDELTKSISEISAQVSNSTRVAAEAVTRANTLDGNIRKLESGSREIENVINLINTIAEQTNLLALNATIEASRAGEAGKGFAVVASEVKNLANQTAGAIDDISELIANVQSEISQAVQSNAQITAIINEIDQVSAGIAAAVEQQTAATSEISRTVQNAASNVTTISGRVGDVSRALENNNKMVTDVLEGVSHIDEQSSSMSHDVSTFLKGLRSTQGDD